MSVLTISEADYGRHNADLVITTTRLINEGSWKRQNVVVMIPAGPTIPTKVYLSHMGLIFPPNQGAIRLEAAPAVWATQDTEVGAGFSHMFEQVVNHPELSKWQYILTIEHDNIPPPDGVVKLIARMEAHPEFACIGGLYFLKGENGCAQIWGDPKDPVLNFRPQLPDPAGGLVECNGTGMGFNLWRMSALVELRKKVQPPWFVTKTGLGGTGVGTQDLAFWGDIGRKHGLRCAIDCGVKVGHFDASTGISW